MDINKAVFCYHCGVITCGSNCPVCGSSNSLRKLNFYLAGQANIPDRLYHMNLAECHNYPHISNFRICDYCFSVLKKTEKCNCQLTSL
jgi:hypothetical protein